MNEQEQPKRGRGRPPLTPEQRAARQAERGDRVDAEVEGWVDLEAENEKLRDLIRWLAPRIERRTGNGTVSDQFCLLCVLGQPQFKRQPCRHGEIWEIGRGV